MTLEEFKDEIVKRKRQAEIEVTLYEEYLYDPIQIGKFEGKITAYATVLDLLSSLDTEDDRR